MKNYYFRYILLIFIIVNFRFSLKAQSEYDVFIHLNKTQFDLTKNPPQKTTISIDNSSRAFNTDRLHFTASRNGRIIIGSDGERIINKDLNYFSGSDSIKGVSNINNNAVSSLGIRQIFDTTIFKIINPFRPLKRRADLNGNIYWSNVELGFEGGKGRVNPLFKNKLLDTGHQSLITFTNACDGNWLISKKYGLGYSAFKINRKGSFVQKVDSDVGPNVALDEINFLPAQIGFLDISKNGNILAQSYGDTLDFIDIYHFDKNTGLISPRTKIILSKGYNIFTSLIFSNNNNEFYAAQHSVDSFQIIKIVLGANYEEVSRKVVYQAYRKSNRGLSKDPPMQVFSDNNLYFSHEGLVWRYDVKNDSLMNLPGFPPPPLISFNFPHKLNYFPVLIPRNATDTLYKCAGVTYPLYSRAPLQNIVWNGTIRQDTLKVTEPGMYTMTGINEFCTYHDTVWVLDRSENIPIKRQYERCAGSGVEVSLPPTMDEVTWDDGSKSLSRVFETGGTFRFKYRTGTCNFVDSVTIVTLDQYNGLPDTVLCGEDYSVDLRNELSTIRWGDGQNSPQRVFSRPGTYTYEAVRGNCTIKDTFTIQTQTSPSVHNITNGINYEYGQSIIINLCKEENIQLVMQPSVSKLTWSGTSKGDTLLLNQDGQYKLQVSVGACTYDFEIRVQADGVLPIPKNLSFCPSDSANIFLPPFFTDVVWQDNGSRRNFRSFTTPGTYPFTAKSIAGCTIIDTVTVSQAVLPKSLISDTTICSSNNLTISLTNNISTLKWENNDTSKVRTLTKAGKYSFEADYYGCILKDSMVLSYYPPDLPLIADTIELCQNQSLPLKDEIIWKSTPNEVTSGIYYYFQKNIQGCIFEYMTYALVKKCQKDCKPLLPNVLKLSNIAVEFYILYECPNTTMSLTLYDRYGNITVSTSFQNNTASFVLNENTQPGIYVYHLHILDEDGRSIFFTGDVYLDR